VFAFLLDWLPTHHPSSGVQLYVETVKNLTASGLVAGFFGDKWGRGAAPNETDGADPDAWLICNKDQCGTVTQAQGQRWNAGKKAALVAATAHVGDGPYYCEGSGGLFEGMVRVFRQKFTLEDAIGSHACSLEANMRVTNGIPLGSSLLLPVCTVNCVQTLKVSRPI
jgi:hypothetical protein